MINPLQITFRNMMPSPVIEEDVRKKTAKLESICDHIIGCRVIVEAPHRRHHKGKSFQVRIELSVPGPDIVINRAPKRLSAVKLADAEQSEKDLMEDHRPSKQGAHEDVYVAVRDAFNAAGRKLQDHVRRQNGAIKVHNAPLKTPSGETSR
jgi:ribosome-associated translation inhibitor RaiA